MAIPNNERKRLALLYIETKYPHIMEERFELARKMSELDFSQDEIEEHIDMIVFRDFPEAIEKSYKAPKPQIKDSGARYVNEKGGQRDLSEGKPDFKYVPKEIIRLIKNHKLSIFDMLDKIYEVSLAEVIKKQDLSDIIVSMIETIGNGNRYQGVKAFALFMEKSAQKYEWQNWLKLDTPEDRERFKISVKRHYVQHYFEETDEYHREAVVFNAMCLLILFNK